MWKICLFVFLHAQCFGQYLLAIPAWVVIRRQLIFVSLFRFQTYQMLTQKDSKFIFQHKERDGLFWACGGVNQDNVLSQLLSLNLTGNEIECWFASSYPLLDIKAS